MKKRKVTGYPTLTGRGNLGKKRWKIDIDYANKLSEEEKKWLDNFLNETVGANFNHLGKKIYKGKKARKKIWNENNAANRCVLNKKEIEKLYDYTADNLNHEDVLNALLDQFNEKLKKS